MRKNYFFLFLLFIISLPSVKAQSFAPFASWNHAGISGVYLQPASIVDTRLKFDMVVFGIDLNVGNSIYGLKRGFLFSGDIDDKFDDYKRPLSKIANHRAMIGMDVQLLNFMVPLSKKSALGVTSRLRYMLNVDGIDADMLDVMESPSGFINNTKYTISDLSFRTNAWAEFGVTYAREILDWGQHYLKGGITLKLIQPITAAYLHIEETGYEIVNLAAGSNNPEDYVKLKASGELAFPKGFKDFEDFIEPEMMFDDWKFGKRMGIGFDFGAVYEYRPDYIDYKDTHEGQAGWRRYEPSKYLFRIGLSILDIGSMKYDSDWTQSFKMPSYGTISEDSITNLSNLRSLFGLKHQNGRYKIALPSAISLQTDWRINRLFYVGVNPYFALRQKKGRKLATHYMTNINIVPRLEMAGLGVSLPISYDQFRAFNVGLGLRMGPLWIGSNNLFNLFMSQKLRALNICLGMKISIHHKREKSNQDIPKIIHTIE